MKIYVIGPKREVTIISKKNTFNNSLNIIIGSSIGVLIGHTLFKFWDYRKYPDLYAIQSAPWYTSSLIYGSVTIVVLIIAIALKIYLRKKN